MILVNKAEKFYFWSEC